MQHSSNVIKSIVGIDASQLCTFSMYQDMPTGLYTRWEFDTDMQKIKARHNRSRNFEFMVMSLYPATRKECKIEIFFTSGKQKKKLTVLMWTVIFITVRQGSKQWDVITTFVLSKNSSLVN